MDKSHAMNGAKYYLTTHGMNLIDENCMTPAGQIDLVFQEDDELVFAMVDYSEGLVMPDEMLAKDDRVRMEIAAASYLGSNDMPSSGVRFDTLKIALLDETKMFLCHRRDAYSVVHEESIDRTSDARRLLGDNTAKTAKPITAKRERSHER
jgi:Holliday junction resolvase-like predicted endonuclease